MSAPLPSLIAPAVDVGTGRFTTAWVGFFRRFGAAPRAIATIKATGSGMTYTADGPGTLVASGGAGVALTLTRGRVSLPWPYGVPLPLAEGDAVKIAYTAAPTLSFVPSGA